MDPKLALFLVFIAVVIALSHLTEDTLGRMRRQLTLRRFRPALRGRG